MNAVRALLLLPGLAMLLYAAWALAMDLRASRWPTVAGRITSVKEKSAGKGFVRKIVNYEYTVGGRQFTNDRYAFGYLAGGIVGAGGIDAKMKRDLPDSPAVHVYYDPADPQRSVLAPRLAYCHLNNVLIPCGYLLLMWLLHSSTR